MKYRFSLLFFALFLLAVMNADAQFQLINTIAGDGVPGFSGDGSAATAAKLSGPLGVVVDSNGVNVYILDYYNHRIRKVSGGVITTVAGNGGTIYSGDGTLATSAAISPYGLAVDKKGNIYISDIAYNVVRKVNTIGIISTVAGNSTIGYSGDGAAATSAQLNTPRGMAFDSVSNLYIADAGNHVIRKVNGAGIISTVAGDDTAGYLGNGGLAINARLDSPFAIAFDPKGNMFITDYKNNVIRKVDTAGIIKTYAGMGSGFYGNSGDNGPATLAELNAPKGIAVDKNGFLYIADADNNVIRMVDTFGIITTVAGNGYPGFGGDLGTVNGANFYDPYGVAVDKFGCIYIADANNERVRKTYSPSLAVSNTVSNTSIVVAPNPFTNNITISGLNITDKICVYDIAGRAVTESWSAAGSTQSFMISNLANGIYMLQVSDAAGNKKAVAQLVKE